MEKSASDPISTASSSASAALPSAPVSMALPPGMPYPGYLPACQQLTPWAQQYDPVWYGYGNQEMVSGYFYQNDANAVQYDEWPSEPVQYPQDIYVPSGTVPGGQ
uniref:YTH domain-containing protein n=1 Tax=Heterorhabditis bacteriophora TaxID=37862 RepID=A0A1I7X1X7_HETBA